MDPKFSIWHIDGHGQQWQRDQLDAGLPLEPSIRMVAATIRNIPKQVTNLNGQAGLLSQLDTGPIVLRMNNIGDELDSTIPRLSPLTEDNWSTSAMSVIRNADGTLNQTPYPDPLGPVEAWAETGRQWATSAWMVRLQEIIPNPTSVLLRENNEGPRHKFKTLYTSKPIEQKINGVKTIVGYTQVWKPRADLLLLSIRIADWVDARRSLVPSTCEAEFIAAENARYHALYAAFDANLCTAWQGKLKTVGYGGFSENLQNPSASVSYYVGGSIGIDTLTDPRHEANMAAYKPQWNEWRELSIRINANAVYAGSNAGVHDVVDPENSAGFWTAIAWRLHGKPVRLVWWDNYNTPPTEPLGEWTLGDYEVALLRGLSRIHTNPIINRYWREGTTTVLSCPLNDSARNRVYATETTIPGEPRKLLFVYSPCDLTGEIQVGEWTVPAKRLGYWLTPLELEEVQ